MACSDAALPVVRAMTAELPRGGLSLPDMADIAHLSPYHFIRVFRQATGVSPGAFQAALRMAEAKRLLLESDVPVTEVCFELGYASLGSFVRRFTADVGLAPGRYRRLTAGFVAPQPVTLAALLCQPPTGGPNAVAGELAADPPAPLGPAFVGLFPQYLPRGLPLAGMSRLGAGRFAAGPVPDGTYALLAAACPAGAGLSGALVHGRGLLVAGAAPVRVAEGRSPFVRLRLRPPLPTDPPVLVALPLLLARAIARSEKQAQTAAG